MTAQDNESSLSREELLSRTRARIDAIDEKLLALLNERSTLSREVGRIKADDKSSIFKPQREQEILERLCSRNTGPLPEDALRSIWREIMSSSRALQRPLRVAYLGPEGTFSYFAGLEFLGHSARYRACVDLPAVFEEVNATTCDLGIVPLENSLQGTVGISFDLFLKYPVTIQAELFSRISHCLLSREENFSDIRAVYSHPQPLAQCAFWLRAHLPGAALIPAESTAAAARKAAETPGAASIGNGSLANMLGLNVLAKRIEDAPGNWTRFVVIAREGEQNKLGSLPLSKEPLGSGHKTSILFTLPDRPGSLSAVLNLFASHRINMRKLESRPLLGERWKYVFFVDVEEDLQREEFRDAVLALNELCNTCRILGSYATGPQLDRVWEPEDSLD